MKTSKIPNSPSGDKNNGQGNEAPAIAWHPAFVQAIQLELEDYRDILEFHSEYQLSSEPLRIDCVIIKKAPHVEIKKNIASLFREVNLLEYKNPDDYVSIEDFYKVYGYACLYASFEKVPITAMTISFVESHHPRNLLAHLKVERGYKVEKNNPGIYTIHGDILPIQIINTRRLSENENLWLKDLCHNLSPKEILRVLAEISRQGKAVRAGTYLDVLARANNDNIKEALDMSSTHLSLEEILEKKGWFAKYEARGEERKAIDVAKKMVSSGFPPETIASITELAPEKVNALYQEK